MNRPMFPFSSVRRMSIPVTHEDINGVQVLTIGSEKFSIEEANLEEISQKLLDHVVSVPPKIIIDMRHVNFFGSSYIETLFRIWNRIKEANGQFGIANLEEYCQEILKVTNLDTVWGIYPDLDTAVKALSEETQA